MKRLLGHIIDVAVVAIIVIIVLQLVTMRYAGVSNFEIDLLYFTLYFIYFFALETNGGKTLGKRLLKMSIRDDTEEGKPSIARICVRTLCRFIPFDALSFLWGGNWHDKISGTYVIVDDIKAEKLQRT